MVCPHCKHSDTSVLDSRDAGEGIRRRRECLRCKGRFTTYERSEPPTIVVIKKDGNRERFSLEKMKRGIVLACKNRPVTPAQLDAVADDLEHRVMLLGKDTVTSKELGSLVQEALQKLDQVAYIRFTSVYKEFSTAREFEEAVQTID